MSSSNEATATNAGNKNANDAAAAANSSSSSSSSSSNKKWSQTVNSYVKYFEPSSIVIGRFLLNGMNLQYTEQPLKVIEAGAGSGGLAKELLSNLNNGLSISKLVITDNSDGMLEKCNERLQEYIMNNNNDDNGGIDVTIEKANFCNFSGEAKNSYNYADGIYDRYYSNLCLHYVSKFDTNNVIKEAYRLLKGGDNNGSIAGFTIWGNPKFSPCMTIVPNVLDELNLVKKKQKKKKGDNNDDDDGDSSNIEQHDNFHLGYNDNELRKRFLNVGFTNVTLIHYPGVIETLDANSFVECIIDGATSTKKQIESYPTEIQKQIRDKVYEKAKHILEDQGIPIILDIIVIWAKK